MLALLCLTVVSAWADGYYVVGTMTGWKVNSQYKLSVNPGNTAEMMIPMYFQAGAEFKVVDRKSCQIQNTFCIFNAQNDARLLKNVHLCSQKAARTDEAASANMLA